jgi:hypothetical protein
MKTIADLFAILETMEFFAGDVPLKNADAYIALKNYLGDRMTDRVPGENIDELSSSNQNKDIQGRRMHFEKRDLNEAEEY